MVAKIDSSSESTSDREIVITRDLAFTRELVWQAMTDPNHVVNWWGPRGFTTTIETMNVKPGGIWKHVMHGPDGSHYPNKSIFTEVEKPERLVYTHAGGKTGGGPGSHFVSTWTFEALKKDETRVTIRMVFPSAEERDKVVKAYGAIEGGQQTLERLGEFLGKKGPLIVERTFAAPASLLWKAITEREAMKEWNFDVEGFKPEVGCEFEFKAGAEDVIFNHLCKVTVVIPEKKIAYTWRYEGYAGDSLVSFELFPEGDKTRVKLTHEGLENFPPIPCFARTNFEMGWTAILGEMLPKYVEAHAS